jgi:hypothetical protein
VNDGGEIGEAHFVSREREAKVGLGEGGDSAAEGGSYGEGSVLASLDRNKGAFVEVNSEAGGSRELI